FRKAELPGAHTRLERTPLIGGEAQHPTLGVLAVPHEHRALHSGHVHLDTAPGGAAEARLEPARVIDKPRIPTLDVAHVAPSNSCRIRLIKSVASTATDSSWARALRYGLVASSSVSHTTEESCSSCTR